MVSPTAEFAFSPLRFASFISVVLPVALSSAFVVMCTTVVPAAPSVFQARVELLQGMVTDLHEAFGTVQAPAAPPTPTQQALYEPFSEPVFKAYFSVDDAARAQTKAAFAQRIEALRTQAQGADLAAVVTRLDRWLTRMQGPAKFEARFHDSGAYNAIMMATIGLGLLCNGVVFRWFMRRRGAEFPHADQADRVFLYYVPARQFWLYVAGLFLVVAANFAHLYQHAELLRAVLAIDCVLVVILFLQLWRCVPTMAAVLSGTSAPPTPVVRRVAWAVFGCVAVSFMFMGSVQTALGVLLMVLGLWLG